MKKILLLSITTCALLANDNFIEIGGGYSSSKDNFSTNSKKSISSLNSAKSEDEALLNLSFHYGKDLNENINIYTGSQMGDLYLGSAFDTNYGLFDFGITTSLGGEAWENPFKTSAKRKKTNMKEYGAYLSYGFDLSENIQSAITYEFTKVSYDKDKVSKDLKRDGNKHILSFENNYYTQLFNKDTALISNLSYEKYDADGKASSYDEYGIELGISSNIYETIQLSFMGNYGKRDYEKTNAEVNKKVEVDVYGVYTEVVWEEAFSYENTYISFQAGHEKQNANANFYDKTNNLALISLGYRF